jgi:two-component system nitrate/nitrite response regulator NarL
MSMHVVIVDDDPGFRRIAAALLAARGLTVVAESVDVASGVEAVLRHSPDGVLLDVNLPDGDGMSVARELVSRGNTSRIVLTSTDGSAWTARELADAGIRTFVPKEQLFDVDFQELFGT